ncbi:hypothetical protein VKT23_018724 [Stygiomarasmius scandens]|uniref:Uncharacterized protein n=1 Tax=Marasmiellus scandens TaxID=2682957 RepID=A0ABR1ISY6_9AGAR
MGADASNIPNAPVPIHKDSDDDEADENPAPLEDSPYLPIPRIPNPSSFEYTTHDLPSWEQISLAPRVSSGGDGPQRIKFRRLSVMGSLRSDPLLYYLQLSLSRPHRKAVS